MLPAQDEEVRQAARAQFSALCAKLDALSHLHFTCGRAVHGLEFAHERHHVRTHMFGRSVVPQAKARHRGGGGQGGRAGDRNGGGRASGGVGGRAPQPVVGCWAKTRQLNRVRCIRSL